MREVEVVAILDGPAAAVRAELSPSAIVDHMGTYSVESIERTDDETVATLSGENLESVVAFTELEDGYEYVQRGDRGPFEEMYTRISVEPEDDERARVTVRSQFSFGGLFGVVKEWFAADVRQEELERLIANLAQAVVDGAAADPAETRADDPAESAVAAPDETGADDPAETGEATGATDDEGDSTDDREAAE